MRKWFFLFIHILIPFSFANTSFDSLFAEGNQSYRNQNYASAIDSWQKADSIAPGHAGVLYNIGNAWYRSGRHGLAIVYYLRALKADPLNKDIRHNLAQAEALRQDLPEPVVSPELAEIWYKLRHVLNLNQLGLLALLLWSVAFGVWMRKHKTPGLYFVLYTLVGLWLASTGMWVYRIYEQQHDKRAVIIVQAADVFSEPSKNSDVLFVLHEGTITAWEGVQEEWVRIAIGELSGFVQKSHLNRVQQKVPH
jgi:tetratricopeptide (TPR) repeat protein